MTLKEVHNLKQFPQGSCKDTVLAQRYSECMISAVENILLLSVTDNMLATSAKQQINQLYNSFCNAIQQSVELSVTKFANV